MNAFPDPIKLPDDVKKARRTRNKEVIRAALLGVIVRSGIIGIELVGVALYGSSALLMDALASLLDLASTIFLIVCVKLASRPPDEDHPFGHGRYEPLAGLQLGLLLVSVGAAMFFQQGIAAVH